MTVFQPGDRVHMWAHVHTPATTGTVTGTTPEGRIFVQWDDTWAVTPHDYETLEPAGETMSQTFKSTNDADDPVHHLTVDASDGEVLIQVHYGQHLKGIHLAPADAPALALAILYEAHSNAAPLAPEVARAMEALEEYKQRIQAEAEATADRAQWEDEALHLYNACRYSAGRTGRDSFGDLDEDQQRNWLGVAHQARHLHGVTK